jgi:outer membrane protein assembly factor BamD
VGGAGAGQDQSDARRGSAITARRVGIMERHHRRYNDAWRHTVSWCVVMVCCAALMGCAGGMPSIPNSPEDIIAKGERYFNRGKYYQSEELFKAFIERHAGDDRSDYAQFMLAESYFKDREYALAAVEYRILVTNYGYSDYVDEGFFGEALSKYYQAPKAELDQSKAYEALSQLEQFVQVYRNSPLVPEAEKYIRLVREKLAQKDLENATFYYGRKRYLSALVYLDKVIGNYPDNRYWVQSKYLKAKILFIRGEHLDDAARLLGEVMDYPEDLRVKRNAQVLLRQIQGK